MELIYQDTDIVVCVKPVGAVSTDEPGGVPSLVREALGEPGGRVLTVHRLDQVVGGLMVLARNPDSAGELSRQIRQQTFCKQYQAVLHGVPEPKVGTLRDLLVRDKRRRMTLVAEHPNKDVQAAELDYRVLAAAGGLSRVAVTLRTGRTHQIRVQFSSRGMPLVGERKYAVLEDGCSLALWSCRLAFTHPATGEAMDFTLEPPAVYPWTAVSIHG